MRSTLAFRRQLFRAIARRRTTRPMAYAAAFCGAFLRAYHNQNWDLASNGVYPGQVDFRSYGVEDETYHGGNFVAVLDDEELLIQVLSGVARERS